MKSTPRYQAFAFKLLRLYPCAWRERYAEEAAAVLEERPATLLTLFDLVLGMLDAYWHNELFTERNFVMIQRLRNNQLTIFSAFVFSAPFIVLYLLFAPRTLPSWDVKSPATNDAVFFLPYSTAIFLAVLAATVCSIIASLLGGGALLANALKRSLVDKGKRSFQPFLWSLLSFLVFASFICLVTTATFTRGPVLPIIPKLLPVDPLLFLFLQLVSNGLRLRQGFQEKILSFRFMQPTLIPGLLGMIAFSITYLIVSNNLFILALPPNTYMFLKPSQAFIIVLVLAGMILVSTIIGGLVYIMKELRRITFAPDFLKLTFIPSSLITFFMLAILLVMSYHVWLLDTHVNARGWTLLSVPLVHIILLGAFISTAIACFSLWRAFRARRALVLA